MGVLHAAGRDDRARAKAETALASLMNIDRVDPRINVANADLALGDAVARTDPALAEKSWRSAATLMEPYVSRSDPKLGAVYAQAMIRLGRRAEVTAVIDAVHRTGYRQPDFEKKVANSPSASLLLVSSRGGPNAN